LNALSYRTINNSPLSGDLHHSAADEIAAVIAFVANPAASFISGAVIPVDGGDRGLTVRTYHKTASVAQKRQSDDVRYSESVCRV
jgi:hypothetical protein